MNDAPYYPQARAQARFRRPKVLQVPDVERGIVRARFEWSEPVHVDELLEVEIPVAGETCCCTARVARVDPIVWKEPTQYEVYLELFNLGNAEQRAVEKLLEPYEPAAATMPTSGSNRYVLQGPFHKGAPFQRPRRDEGRDEGLEA